MDLTQKQQTFVAEYLTDLNATKAAIRAGYSVKTAQEQGSRLLSNAMVQEEVRRAMDERAERTAITQDYVLYGILRVVEATRQDQPAVALKGFELLGRHLKLFTDRRELSSTSAEQIRLVVDL